MKLSQPQVLQLTGKFISPQKRAMFTSLSQDPCFNFSQKMHLKILAWQLSTISGNVLFFRTQHALIAVE